MRAHHSLPQSSNIFIALRSSTPLEKPRESGEEGVAATDGTGFYARDSWFCLLLESFPKRFHGQIFPSGAVHADALKNVCVCVWGGGGGG